MNRRGSSAPFVLVGLALVVFIGVVALVVRDRLRSGDVFPEYSSLRADPKGYAVLHDVLVEKGFFVDRQVRPLGELRAEAGDVVVLAGVENLQLAYDDELAKDIDRAVMRGATVLILHEPLSQYATKADKARKEGEALRLERQAERDRERERQRAEDRKRRGVEDPKPVEKPKEKSESGEGASLVKVEPPKDHWKFSVIAAQRPEGDEDPPIVRAAVRAPGANVEYPGSVQVAGAGRLELGESWKALYLLDAQPVLAELPRARGRLLVASDAYILSNEALAVHRPGRLIEVLFKDAKRVVFHEHHLGVSDNRTLADLMRSYGLGPAMLAVIGVFVLMIWRGAAQLVPARAERDGSLNAPPVSGASALQPLLVRALKTEDTPARLLALAQTLPARHRPDEARLAAMKRLLSEIGWEKPRPGPLEIYRRMCVIAAPKFRPGSRRA